MVMVGVILVFILVMVFWSFVLYFLDLDVDDTSVFVGCILGLILAFAVPYYMGTKSSFYTAEISTQPVVSIYADKEGDQVYLKTLSGSKLVYWIMEDGVPREQIAFAKSIKQVVFEDSNPYVETTNFSFAKKWYKLFMFDDKSDVYVFYVPESGIESDIGSFLK